jgi:hypothetical protein
VVGEVDVEVLEVRVLEVGGDEVRSSLVVADPEPCSAQPPRSAMASERPTRLAKVGVRSMVALLTLGTYHRR